ncbi:COG complex component [Rickenella mellea]|uniref:Conserved oligomeric Golgi complex subunit 2 n=1 Tax=Rickenella mellea TaxID=50990 RepID=A0A4Y7QFH6_9AGAM|nr:COG complex component [Rickenella mellea]
MANGRRRSSAALTSDPFELDRLAEELALRENGPASTNRTSHEFPQLLPLSHDNTYLKSSTFSVEQFLLSRSFTSLPDLRAELRDYLAKLKDELVQLINDDYEAFISLSTDLRGEGTRLERLKWPLRGLRNEILESRSQLQGVQQAVDEKLQKRSSLREEKALLHLLLKIADSVSRLESLLLIASSDKQAPNGMRISEELNAATLEPHDDRGRGNRAKHLFRVATEYTQLLYHTGKARAEDCAFVNEIDSRIDRIKSTLSSDLDHLFSSTLLALVSKDKKGREKQSDADKIKLMSDLTECLRTYDMLSLWRDAEDVLRKDIVRDFVKRAIYLGALNAPPSPLLPRTPFVSSHENTSGHPPRTPYTPYTAFVSKQNPFFADHAFHTSSTLPHGYLLEESDNSLAALFNKILKFVDRDMKGIMDAAERVGVKRVSAQSGTTVKATGNAEDGFEILANVIWAEVGRAILDDLGSVVFAAGQPDEFRKNYETTQAFIRSLEYLAPSLHSIRCMRSHPVYESFHRRWQLPVYFQLRWKDIIGELEDDLEQTTLDTANISSQSRNSNIDGFATRQAKSVYNAIAACWSADIYIPDLSHRFWKLTLQVLSRYRVWLDASLVSLDLSSSNAGPERLPGTPSSASRAATPIPHSDFQTADRKNNDDASLRHCAAAVQDIKQMQTQVMTLWRTEISVLIPTAVVEGEDDTLEDVLIRSLSALTDLLPPMIAHITSILSGRACEALTPVKSIPGQYRAMSSKHIPSTPSQFVALIFRPAKAFFGVISEGGEGRALKDEFAAQIISELFETVANRYIMHLTAMKKTEESLRRLKKGKRSGFSLFGGGSANDEDNRDEERVKAQMVLDVEAFGKDAESLGVDVHNSDSFKALNYMVHANMADGGDQ